MRTRDQTVAVASRVVSGLLEGDGRLDSTSCNCLSMARLAAVIAGDRGLGGLSR